MAGIGNCPKRVGVIGRDRPLIGIFLMGSGAGDPIRSGTGIVTITNLTFERDGLTCPLGVK